MRTFLFNYEPSDPSGFNFISFCAKSVKEAKNLFNDYCKNDLRGFKPKTVSVASVYDADDHAEYGKAYRW